MAPNNGAKTPSAKEREPQDGWMDEKMNEDVRRCSMQDDEKLKVVGGIFHSCGCSIVT
jgi:hypothetical protein